MRIKRALAASVLAAAALGSMPAAVANDECTEKPNHHCYECVRYPCYPEDYPPYILSLILGDGS